MRALAGAYRVVAMAALFSIFGIGALVLSLVFFPAAGLLLKGEKRRRACRALTSLSFRIFLRVCSLTRLLSLECEGALPHGASGQLFIANHPSLLDYVILCSMIPDCGCLIKASLTKNPFIRGVISGCGYIPNGGDPASTVGAMAAALESGQNFLIFPEGTRTRVGAPMHMHHGFARAALASRCPIACARIDYSGRALRKGAPFYFAYYGKSEYHVEFFRPFSTIDFIKRHGGGQECSLARSLAQLAGQKLSAQAQQA